MEQPLVQQLVLADKAPRLVRQQLSEAFVVQQLPRELEPAAKLHLAVQRPRLRLPAERPPHAPEVVRPRRPPVPLSLLAHQVLAPPKEVPAKELGDLRHEPTWPPLPPQHVLKTPPAPSKDARPHLPLVLPQRAVLALLAELVVAPPPQPMAPLRPLLRLAEALKPLRRDPQKKLLRLPRQHELPQGVHEPPLV